ncbi:hypothetical protein AB0M32_10405 [Streptomyces sp. NPDC051985]|uniref:S10 family peptidase n=1 Tax=Streptomyces sp. NPDC051985 TaxID=3155807 RepID=UPI00341B17E5
MTDTSPRGAEDAVAQVHTPPLGAHASGKWTNGVVSLEYEATAEWLPLRRKERPVAEIFSVSYTVDAPDRPVVFVFNGGPGGASAFLHLGAVGPRRIDLPGDGSLPAMPPRLVNNDESWLAVADLVFVDPVGTGFSRVVDGAPGSGEAVDPEHYFGHLRDLDSFSEFIGRWLSAHRRWGSPVFLAGESYGGYRVGRLVRHIQETAGVGLTGAILISPALELSALTGSDYDVLRWVDMLPTMVAAAVHHGRSRAFEPGTPLAEVLAEAEEFATGDYATFLIRGASMPAEDSGRVLARLAELTGIPLDVVTRVGGRLTSKTFSRELLRDQRKVLTTNDAALVAIDPFPDREPYAGPDLGESGIISAYTAGINEWLRNEIGVETERDYVLLNKDVTNAWREDAPPVRDFPHFFRQPPGATDDLRYAMSLNPALRVLVVHGRHDLSTPYYASTRLRNLMRLSSAAEARLTVRHVAGGHMFYSWESSRREFADMVGAFIEDEAMPG